MQGLRKKRTLGFPEQVEKDLEDVWGGQESGGGPSRIRSSGEVWLVLEPHLGKLGVWQP